MHRYFDVPRWSPGALVLGLVLACQADDEPVGFDQQPLASVALSTAGFQQGIWMGAAIDPAALFGDPTYRSIVDTHFVLLAPENAFKLAALQPSRGQYTFGDADAIANYARQTSKRIFGHVLVWGEPAALPAWLTALAATDPSAFASAVQQHIYTVVPRFADVTIAWDVVNEAVKDDGSGLRSNVFTAAMGADYVATAFLWADGARRSAGKGPADVALFYNDYALEWNGPKTDRVFTMIRDLRQRGIPIEGIGFQAHLDGDNLPPQKKLEAAVRRFASLGLQIHISEIDVARTRNNAADLAVQSSGYRMALDVCKAVPQCNGFVTWGVSDARTWLNLPQYSLYTFYGQPFEPDYPLLFSANGAAKPAYDGVQRSLQTGCRITTPICRSRPDLPAGYTFFDRWASFSSDMDATRCRERGQDYAAYCRNNYPFEAVNASYVVDGVPQTSWDIGGQEGFSGCLVRQAGCAVQNSWQSVTFADASDPQGRSNTNLARCMERAREFSQYCQNPPNVFHSTSYVVNGFAQATAYFPARPAGCLIYLTACPNFPSQAALGAFYDAYDNANRDSGRCMRRAADYHAWCGLTSGIPVTARFFGPVGAATVEYANTVFLGN